MKIEKAFLRSGLILADAYNKAFGIVPSEYYSKCQGLGKGGFSAFAIGTETPFSKNENAETEDSDTTDFFDMEKIDRKFILEIFPDAEISWVFGKFREHATSCAADKNVEQKIHYGGLFLMSEYHDPCMMFLLRDMKVLVSIIEEGVALFYDGNDMGFDPEKFVDDLVDKLPLKVEEDEDNPSIYLVGLSTQGQYYSVESEINPTTIDIDKNYNDDFKDAYDAIVDFIGSKTRKSGLVLLNGEPGTGKTYFIRHLITHFKDTDFILITPSMASRLASPDFIDFLISNKDSVFVLEDCEQVIMDRKNNSFSSAISSILNMSDGLMSDVFNGKFICTYNADVADIDEAIMRKGRCFAQYTFDKLCEEKSKALLKERGIDVEKPGDMTLADIYNYEVKNIDEKPKKKIGYTD